MYTIVNILSKRLTVDIQQQVVSPSIGSLWLVYIRMGSLLLIVSSYFVQYIKALECTVMLEVLGYRLFYKSFHASILSAKLKTRMLIYISIAKVWGNIFTNKYKYIIFLMQKNEKNNATKARTSSPHDDSTAFLHGATWPQTPKYRITFTSSSLYCVILAHRYCSLCNHLSFPPEYTAIPSDYLNTPKQQQLLDYLIASQRQLLHLRQVQWRVL